MTKLITSFGGVPTPSFLRIEKLGFSAMPEQHLKQADIPGRDGAYYFGKRKGIRRFEADFTIVAPNKNSVMNIADELANWLDHKDPQPLILRDKPGLVYYAVVDNSVDIERFSRTGKGSISFLCHDPYGYSATETVINFNPTSLEEPINVINTSNQDAFPSIRLPITSNSSSLTLVTNGEYLTLGVPATTEKVVQDLSPQVFHDDMSSITGWTSSMGVSDGTVTGGGFVSSGSAFRVSDFGTGSGWHGAAARKALTAPVQDFKVQIRLGNLVSKIGLLGRVEYYVLDVDGNIIARLHLQSGDPNRRNPIGRLYVGGTLVLDTSTGRKRNTAGAWKHFDDGYMTLQRRGNVWEISFSIYDYETGLHHTRYFNRWTDARNNFKQPMAQMQIYMAAHGTSVASHMFITDIKVWELLARGSNVAPVIFKAGDVLEIESYTGKILLNGEPFMAEFDPASQFPILEPGNNGFLVSPLIVSGGTIKFRERR